MTADNFWQKYEKLIVAIIIVAVLSLSFFPVVYGYLVAAKNDLNFYSYDFITSGDYSVYLSLIEQGRQGNFLFENLYTAEAQTPSIFSPLWLVMGLSARVTGLSNTSIFHLWRLVMAVVFL